MENQPRSGTPDLRLRIMNRRAKYVAELAHVREVSLLGTANLTFWRDRLAKENLIPAERDGQAKLLILAADSRFMGIPFTEISFCIFVSRHQDGTQGEGFYLAHAFNSRRLFAFCERAFFSTPYYHGDVRVSVALPASIELRKGEEKAFRAEMQADSTGPKREPSRNGEDAWEGPIFLPGTPGKWNQQGKVFFAKIQGPIQTYPFLHSKDSLTIRPSEHSEILQALIDSDFAGKEWAVRQDAMHAKSKTYKRAEVLTEVALR
jgi:hypothetical protein